MMTSKHTQQGFTLFIAVVTASVVLAIGISILNITLKEFILSGVTRESEMAFYAADAGMECALYWDYSQEGIAEATFAIDGNEGSLSCMGESHEVGGGSEDYGDAQTFILAWGEPALCAHVSVTKRTGGSCPSGTVCTIVESRGYNRGCDAIDDPRAVERALRSEY